jgi:nucleoside-diphosphate kinase
MERTFVMFKPDCLERGLLGRILARFEEKGLRLVAMKMLRVTPALAKQHYAEHVAKPFYPGQMNLVHASDSPESAAREIGIYFKADEILAWDPSLACWLQAPGEA